MQDLNKIPLTSEQLLYNKENYRWFRDSKILGLIFLIINISLIIFSYIEIPFFSTVPHYTIGLFFGHCAPFIYAFFIYKSLIRIFGKKLAFPKWFKFKDWSYLFLVFLITFIVGSSGFFQSKLGWNKTGSISLQSLNIWFDQFTDSSNGHNWYLPLTTNAGILGATFYAIFGLISGLGALIIAIVLFVLFTLFLIIFSKLSHVNIKNNFKKNKIKQSKLLFEKENKTLKSKKILTSKNKVLPKEESKLKSDELPFEDPF